MTNIDPKLHSTAEVLLTPAEAAIICRVSTVTMSGWARAGKIPCVRMPSGHRRFKESDILAMLGGEHDFSGRTDLETYVPEDD